ncbi:hemoglobin-2-like [Trachemys scripta elegans]|uniref:hemoglobin-2-like n=1 Tax=Trachemys scripta elegans TaxID=31138 RepID=UPI0015577DC0|nr:hemoglobin-2-like [Trachemys scripta elegans]
MGCALSGSGIAPGKTISESKRSPSSENLAAPKAGPEHGGDGLGAGPFPLADAQKERIQESWRILHDNIARVGIIVFIRVMSFIEKSVARLDQEDKLEQLAFELGRSHYRYNAPPKYYEYVGIQFISTVQPILKERWTPEVEEAWQSLFRYLTATMKRGYYEEEEKSGSIKSPALKKPGTGSILNSI